MVATSVLSFELKKIYNIIIQVTYIMINKNLT